MRWTRTLTALLALAALSSQAMTFSEKDLVGVWWSECRAPSAELWFDAKHYGGDFEGEHPWQRNGERLVLLHGLPEGHAVQVSGRARSFEVVNLTPTTLMLREADTDLPSWRLRRCD